MNDVIRLVLNDVSAMCSAYV